MSAGASEDGNITWFIFQKHSTPVHQWWKGLSTLGLEMHPFLQGSPTSSLKCHLPKPARGHLQSLTHSHTPVLMCGRCTLVWTFGHTLFALGLSPQGRVQVLLPERLSRSSPALVPSRLLLLFVHPQKVLSRTSGRGSNFQVLTTTPCPCPQDLLTDYKCKDWGMHVKIAEQLLVHTW